MACNQGTGTTDTSTARTLDSLAEREIRRLLPWLPPLGYDRGLR